MRNLYLGLKFSLSYFSNFPISFRKDDDLSNPKVLGAMLFFLPLVGVLLGGFTILIYTILSPLGWYGAIISAVIYMMLYGFLHTEAIIDIVDAIYAKHSGKDAYKVIKESSVGAMGVLYAVGIMLIKVSGIIYIFLHGLLSEFVAIVLLSRLSLVILIDTLDFKSSFVTKLKESLTGGYLIASFILFTIIGSILTPFFIIFMVFGFAISIVIAILIGRELGFINGDVLGLL